MSLTLAKSLQESTCNLRGWRHDVLFEHFLRNFRLCWWFSYRLCLNSSFNGLLSMLGFRQHLIGRRLRATVIGFYNFPLVAARFNFLLFGF